MGRVHCKARRALEMRFVVSGIDTTSLCCRMHLRGPYFNSDPPKRHQYAGGTSHRWPESSNNRFARLRARIRRALLASVEATLDASWESVGATFIPQVRMLVFELELEQCRRCVIAPQPQAPQSLIFPAVIHLAWLPKRQPRSL